MGLRQGGTLSLLPFSMFISDLEAVVSSKYKGVIMEMGCSHFVNSAEDLDTFMRMFVRQYAVDTFLKESESDIKEAVNATSENCRDNNMSMKISKAKYMICSRKVKKAAIVFVNSLPIERVDTFTYLGIVFECNNFQAAKKMLIRLGRHCLI